MDVSGSPLVPRLSSPTLRILLVALPLALVGFAINAVIGIQLDRRGAFNDYNIVFTSDTSLYLPLLTQGAYYSRRHPLVHVFAYSPVWAGAKLLSPITGREEAALRRSLLFLAVPLLNGVKTALLLFCLARLGIPWWFTAIIALIDIASLGRTVFGSILDSYGAFASASMTAYHLAAGSPAKIRPSRRVGCGVLIAGLNITGIVPFAIVLLAALRPDRDGWRRSFINTGQLVGAATLVVLALHFGSASFRNPIRSDPSSSVAQSPKPNARSTTRAWFHFQPAMVGQRAPSALMDSFTGPHPLVQATHF